MLLMIGIRTENVAMRSRAAVARALREVAAKIESGEIQQDPRNRYRETGIIVDANGNRVGSFTYRRDRDDRDDRDDRAEER